MALGLGNSRAPAAARPPSCPVTPAAQVALHQGGCGEDGLGDAAGWALGVQWIGLNPKPSSAPRCLALVHAHLPGAHTLITCAWPAACLSACLTWRSILPHQPLPRPQTSWSRTSRPGSTTSTSRSWCWGTRRVGGVHSGLGLGWALIARPRRWSVERAGRMVPPSRQARSLHGVPFNAGMPPAWLGWAWAAHPARPALPSPARLRSPTSPTSGSGWTTTVGGLHLLSLHTCLPGCPLSRPLRSHLTSRSRSGSASAPHVMQSASMRHSLFAVQSPCHWAAAQLLRHC